MFTRKDIEARSIFVINCIEKERNLRVRNGELLLEENNQDMKSKVLTKFPFQKILLLFIVGNITITTPLIDKCKRFNVALVVVKPNLRPVFFWADSAEGNYLLRIRQYEYSKDDLSIAKILVINKINNQLRALIKTRRKDLFTNHSIDKCNNAVKLIPSIDDYNVLMGIEGNVSKSFFFAYFQDLEWRGRKPRIKSDIINVSLDIGYSILFNFIESIVRMFGFDIYIGVYHRLWFKRKSLICDLIEPFRCIIDHTILMAFNRKQFSSKDFDLVKNEYYLKREKSIDYYRVFFDAIIKKKSEIFCFVQSYYRNFMGCKSINSYPKFIF